VAVNINTVLTLQHTRRRRRRRRRRRGRGRGGTRRCTRNSFRIEGDERVTNS